MQGDFANASDNCAKVFIDASILISWLFAPDGDQYPVWPSVDLSHLMQHF
jgi:hypothetical protein